MLLAIDIGNTSVACALFRRRQIVRRFRIPTASVTGVAGLARLLRRKAGRGGVDGCSIVSVVPKLDATFRAACRRAFDCAPLFATPATIGMPLGGYPRRQIGADRLVGVLAAFARHRRAIVVVDIGSGITFDAVDASGCFRGGAIAPGPELMGAALATMTAKLPLVHPRRARRAIGRNTRAGIEAGLFFGVAGLVDRIVHLVGREMRTRPLVVATGGFATLIAPASKTIRRVEPDLLFEGLRLVWERNRA